MGTPPAPRVRVRVRVRAYPRKGRGPTQNYWSKMSESMILASLTELEASQHSYYGRGCTYEEV